MAENDTHTAVFDISTVRAAGEDAIKFGADYEKCIGLSVTMDDGVSPIPDFVHFEALSRTLTASPSSLDLGLYLMQVNFDYMINSDPDNNPETHEHSVPLSLEVTRPFDTTDVSKYHIPLNETETEQPKTNNTNLNDTNTEQEPVAVLDDQFLEELAKLLEEDEEKKTEEEPKADV